MNQLIFYLNQLHRYDFKKLLANYLPKPVLSEEILAQFTDELYFRAEQFELKGFIDSREWIENETERFCTVNPHTGYPFKLKRATR